MSSEVRSIAMHYFNARALNLLTMFHWWKNIFPRKNVSWKQETFTGAGSFRSTVGRNPKMVVSAENKWPPGWSYKNEEIYCQKRRLGGFILSFASIFAKVEFSTFLNAYSIFKMVVRGFPRILIEINVETL